MTTTATYDAYRTRLETYFDRTALDAWAQLTSDAPVSRIRATVRAGRERMRATLLDWLPDDLSGRRILDAGCGTGALAIELARRGADVVGVDVATGLISIACERARVANHRHPREGGDPYAPTYPNRPAAMDSRLRGNDGRGSLSFLTGDMLAHGLGRFDHVVAMDSLIHYPAAEIERALTALAARTERSILFTFAPRTPALSLMHAAGKLFPRGERSPAIIPVAESLLRRRLAALPGWSIGRSRRIASGFYTSHALELVRG